MTVERNNDIPKEEITMKRIERNTYNSLRKSISNDTICVEIPTSYTKEGKQEIHNMLTIEKHMVATRINWNSIENEYVIHYIPCDGVEEFETKRKQQENMDIDEITSELCVSDYTWNGYKKPNEETEEAQGTTNEEEQNMKNTNEISFEIRQLDAWGNAEEGYEINTSYHMGEMTTKAQNERKAFTAWMKRHLGISFKKNRTLIEYDGDCYTIIDRKSKEPLFIAIPNC